MNVEQAKLMKRISENIMECWVRIKTKARVEGHITNIEKYSPCLTGTLNNMEQFLSELHKQEEAEKTAIRCG